MSDKRINKTEEEGKAMEVKVPHPDFGYVIFTEPTPRQNDILEHYKRLINGTG